MPSTANGGITNGGKTYTFHIKPGVDWNTTPPRQVTAADFIREFKAFFNPVSPVGNPVYYESHDRRAHRVRQRGDRVLREEVERADRGEHHELPEHAHDLRALRAELSSTLQFTLIAPASDFLYMMAMPFTSARPVEYDSYVPNSLELDQHTISDGPYQISSYIPGKSITMVRNPAWKQSTDSLRHDYVSTIVDTLGVTSAETQLSDMQAGTQDVQNDTPINPASIPSLVASNAPNFNIWPWSTTFPYIVFNLRSPDANGAAGKLLVRQAVEYGLDKSAAVKAIGGPAVGQIINTVIPPGNTGYQNTNLYPDDNGQGNVAMCKSDLAKAGYPNGVTLTYMYPNDSSNTRIFTAIQASLANCGITLTGKPEPGSSFFTDLGNAPENNKAGQWDMGQPGWIPDWFGNNGRTVVQALFQGPNCVINTVNYGCYNNAKVNSLITTAEAATSLSAAGTAWQQADAQIMSDAAIVPDHEPGLPAVLQQAGQGYRPRTTYPTALFAPNIGDPDITKLWLASS